MSLNMRDNLIQHLYVTGIQMLDDQHFYASDIQMLVIQHLYAS